MPTLLPSKPIARLSGHNGPVHALTFSSGTGSYVLTGSADRTVNLYNPSKPSSSTLVKSYTGAHGHAVLALSVSPDNSRFASAGGERSAEIFVWDVSSARTVRRFGDHPGRVEACAFGGQGGDDVLVTGGFDAAVRIWDCRSQSSRPIMALKEAKDSVNSLVVRGAEIFAGGVDGRVRCYDIRMGCLYVDVCGAAVMSLDVSIEGGELLIGTADGRIRLLDKSGGSLLKEYSDKECKTGDYRIKNCFAAKEACVLSGSEGGHVYVWDVLSGERVQRLRHIDGQTEKVKSGRRVVSCVATKKAGSEWASAGGDGSVCVWG